MSDAANSPSSGEIETQANTPAPADNASASATPSNSDAATAPSSGADAATSGPSPEPVSERDALLSVVRDAVAPKEPKAPATETPETTAAKPADSDPAAPPAPDPAADSDLTDDQLKGFKPDARRYVSKLTRQRNDARDALATVQPELTAHRELVGYLNHHQLAPEDVNLLLGVGAALRRGDYKAFLDGIEPYREVARQSLGLDISPDLRPQVDDGLMSEDAARELTRTRLDAARHKVEADTQTQRLQTRDQSHATDQMRGAIDSWEQGVRQRDPDYARKEALVRRASQALLYEHGVPKNPRDAVAMAQRAYDEVSAEMRRVSPAPQPTRRTPSGLSTPSLGAAAEPRSLREAAMLGLSRAQRAAP